MAESDRIGKQQANSDPIQLQFWSESAGLLEGKMKVWESRILKECKPNTSTSSTLWDRLTRNIRNPTPFTIYYGCYKTYYKNPTHDAWLEFESPLVGIVRYLCELLDDDNVDGSTKGLVRIYLVPICCFLGHIAVLKYWKIIVEEVKKASNVDSLKATYLRILPFLNHLLSESKHIFSTLISVPENGGHYQIKQHLIHNLRAVWENLTNLSTLDRRLHHNFHFLTNIWCAYVIFSNAFLGIKPINHTMVRLATGKRKYREIIYGTPNQEEILRTAEMVILCQKKLGFKDQIYLKELHARYNAEKHQPELVPSAFDVAPRTKNSNHSLTASPHLRKTRSFDATLPHSPISDLRSFRSMTNIRDDVPAVPRIPSRYLGNAPKLNHLTNTNERFFLLADPMRSPVSPRSSMQSENDSTKGTGIITVSFVRDAVSKHGGGMHETSRSSSISSGHEELLPSVAYKPDLSSEPPRITTSQRGDTIEMSHKPRLEFFSTIISQARDRKLNSGSSGSANNNKQHTRQLECHSEPVSDYFQTPGSEKTSLRRPTPSRLTLRYHPLSPSTPSTSGGTNYTPNPDLFSPVGRASYPSPISSVGDSSFSPGFPGQHYLK